MGSYTIPPVRSAFDHGLITDTNDVSSILTALGRFCVLNTEWSGGADPTGTADSTTAIQAALDAAASVPGQMVYLPSPGVYKITSPLSVATSTGLFSHFGTWPYSGGNYGVGGIATVGAMLKPSSAFSGSAVIDLGKSGASQVGGQRFCGIGIDGSGLPAGTVHGFLAASVAGVVMRDCFVTKMTGDGVHAAGTTPDFTPPDFWRIDGSKFSLCAGYGFYSAGLADSFITSSECTANSSGGWYHSNGGDTRYVNCRGSSNGTASGWTLAGSGSFSGTVLLLGCESNLNATGFTISGSPTGPGTYRIIAPTVHGNTADWAYSGTSNIETLAAYNTSTVSPTLT